MNEQKRLEIILQASENKEDLIDFAEKIISNTIEYEEMWVVYSKDIHLRFKRYKPHIISRHYEEHVFAHPFVDGVLDMQYFKIINRRYFPKSSKSIFALIQQLKGETKMFRIYNLKTGDYGTELFEDYWDAIRKANELNTQHSGENVVSYIN